MEKFSQFRDASTGVQPFTVPLAPNSDPLPPIASILLAPFAALLGSVRTLVVLLLLGAQLILVEGVLRVFSPVEPLYAVLTRAANAAISRLILAVVGVLWIKVETVRLKRTGRSPPQVPFAPKKGDLVVANSSSYLDLLYLAFRFNPTFLLPVTSPSSPNKITGFRRVSLFTALLASGALPKQQADGGESLEEALKKASGPAVLFPEATTSNSRALLKFPELAQPASSSASGKTTSVRVFVLAFKYPSPTRLAPTLTYPIPSTTFLGLPLPHLFSLTRLASIYTFSVRLLHASECPRLTLTPGANPTKDEWDALSETLAGAGRLKKVGGLGWVEKGKFLEMRRLKGR
ncbi:hypothetical protein JCM8097_008832 [Rhodosporidiobolus ruineniae]